ncbi:MAG: hypothetical protein HY819_25070, partial [Acidobacteria bacterium]|nr:hypothetical protein [Acidobacteriota bacterium]
MEKRTPAETTEVVELDLDLEFFRVVLGWSNIVNLPSFSVAKGDELGWSILNRELQKCHIVKEVMVENKYLVAIQKEKDGGVAIGEGKVLAQAAMLALIYTHQRVYANVAKIKEFKEVLAKKYKEQVFLSKVKSFYLRQNFNEEGKMMNSDKIEGLSTYKAIALLGRQSVDKLVENGLLVISARDYNNLRADLHAISAELEVLNKSQRQKKLVETLPDIATMTKDEIA